MAVAHSPLVRRLKSFIGKSPQASYIRVERSNGDATDVNASGRQIDLAKTIEALSPVSVEAFSKDGQLLRAETLGEAEPAPDEQGEQASFNVPIPSALATDPETARVHHFANLIHENMKDVVRLLISHNDRQAEELREERARRERAEDKFLAERRGRVDDVLDRLEDAFDDHGGEGRDAIIQAFGSALSGGFGAGSFGGAPPGGGRPRKRGPSKPNGKA